MCSHNILRLIFVSFPLRKACDASFRQTGVGVSESPELVETLLMKQVDQFVDQITKAK